MYVVNIAYKEVREANFNKNAQQTTKSLLLSTSVNCR